MKTYRGYKRFADPVLAGLLVVRVVPGFHPRARRNLRIVLLLVPLLVGGRAVAAELRVPGDHGTITAAIRAADDGDTIRVATGTYSVATGEVFPLRLDRAVSLEGDPNDTPHLQGDGRHTVVLIESGGVTLRGFRITDGLGSEGINNMDGGGICIFVGPAETRNVSIVSCLIENNTCPSDETYDGCGGGIYCGGTYCTCFAIRIVNCSVAGNSVHGQGGGVFCALLSNVEMKDTSIIQNTADDHGGGVFVDVFALLDMTSTCVILNNCPGDRLKANWGGKGGGLACESFGVFSATDCSFVGNQARYYGGGIFTRGGLFAGEDLCGGEQLSPLVAKSRIEKNRADVAGGGVYVASSAVLLFSDTTFYWNDANQVGGAVFVNGGGTGGGVVDLSNGCLLEGNESGQHGGGVYLGQGASGTFDSVRFLGNSSLLDGGGLFLDDGANAGLTNCLVAYNNSARRHAGGLYVSSEADIGLVHCSIVGNFAPHQRSGLYLDPDATADINDSILWRNAGGSVEANGAAVNIATSLNEDGADPNRGVLCCEPRYVGWGSRETIYVDASSPISGDGTAQQPYRDLQRALNSFDFGLAVDSPCLGTAGDGGHMGSDTGAGGTAGNVTAALDLADGFYGIRGRNIIFTRGLKGTDPNTSVIRHAVLGYIEDTSIRDLGITSEEIFGGITIRADADFIDCNVAGNTALADGGGIYVADGKCVLSDSLVSCNVASVGNGGGIFLSPQTSLKVISSHIQHNISRAGKGGGIYASADTAMLMTQSIALSNESPTDGGGLYLEPNTMSSLERSRVSGNKADTAAGMYLSGDATIDDCEFSGNHAARYIGALYVNLGADAAVLDSRILSNYAADTTGGIVCLGQAYISRCLFQENRSYHGAALQVQEPTSVVFCEHSQFVANDAGGPGGAIRCWVNTAPVFVDCNFIENRAYWGGAGICESGTHPTFERCQFTRNKTSGGQGGSFFLRGSSARFLDCTFTESSSPSDGGAAWCESVGALLFENCRVERSVAGANGGAFCISSAAPAFSTVQVVDCQAAGNGGGIAILGPSIPVFSQVTMTDCHAVLFGGGVYATDDTQGLFEKCNFLNNETTGVSADGGGAFFRGDAKGWFTQCVFRNNVANDDGGGVGLDEQAALDLRNTLFAANTARNTGGGAFFTSQSAGTLRNCTLAQNVADGQRGGGIYTDSVGVVKVGSSIICRNVPEGIQPGAAPSVSYSCVQGASVWPGPGNLLCDDCCLLDPESFAPQDSSPCIDAGDPAPNMNDACQPPGKETLRNDMGITGGPDNCAHVPSSDRNLAAWWTFDRIMDVWVLDSSGRGQHALVDGPTSVPGRLGEALDFDGVDDYVTATIDVSEKDYAVSLWFKTRSPEGGLFSVIYGVLGAGGHDRHVYLSAGSLTARVWNNEVIRTTGRNYADDNWHCVIHTFGGDQGGQKLYVDGELKASGSKSFSDFYWQTAVNIGYSADASQVYYRGQLDEVRIYNRSLSLVDVQRLANP